MREGQHLIVVFDSITIVSFRFTDVKGTVYGGVTTHILVVYT